MRSPHPASPPPERALPPATLHAIHLISRAFRAGLPLRPLLDFFTAAPHAGATIWPLPAAQHLLLLETLHYTPPSAPPSFTFGQPRLARLLRLLLDELDHISPAPEIHPDLLDAAAAACTAPPAPQPPHVFVVFAIPTPSKRVRHVPVAISSRFSDLSHRVWEASLVLHSHAITPHTAFAKLLNRAIVLELGAGTGLSAVAFEEASVARAILTDFDALAVVNIARNVRNNLSNPALVDAQGLDIAEAQRVRETADREKVDVVVAADVTYDPGLSKIVIAAFEAVLRDAERVGFLFATSRNEESDNDLDRRLAISGLQVEMVKDKPDFDCYDYLHPWSDLNRVRVFKLTSGAL